MKNMKRKINTGNERITGKTNSRENALYRLILWLNPWQKAAGGIVMDADATAALHNMGVAATDDTSKFTWFQVGG